VGRTVPVSASVAPGNFETAALWNAQVKALNDFLTAPPVCFAYQTVAQSLTTGTVFQLTMDSESIDSDGGHSTVTNTSRYTATVPGTYLVLGNVAISGSTAGYRVGGVKLNGTIVRGSQVVTNPISSSGSTPVVFPVWAIVTMNGATDYVEIYAQQTSGGSLNTYIGAADMISCLAVYFLSR